MRVLRMKRFILSVVAVWLAACSPTEEQAREEYDRLMQLPDAEGSDKFRSLPPGEQVDLYLFGVEHFRPSDYYLAGYFKNPNTAVIAELVTRLRTSKSPERTFALMLVLHNVSYVPSEVGIESGLSASAECDRFFVAPSPCHQLAKDIDVTLVRNRRA